MAKGDNLGEFEKLVMFALLRLRENAYGVTIRQELAHRADRDIAIGAVYGTLDRLATKGFVSSRVGEATPERGGRAKRYFTVTPEGLRALRSSQEVMARMMEGLTLAEVGG